MRVTAAQRYTARKTNTYGRSMSVPRSRRRIPIASTLPLVLAPEEALEEAAAREDVRVALAQAVRHPGFQEGLQPIEQRAPEAGALDAPVGDREPSLAGRAGGKGRPTRRRAGERAVQLERPRRLRPVLRR